RNGPLSESKAIEYITKVGKALEYIHSKNMTHFDVKPANIVVRRSDNEPILIDFGLSKQYDQSGDATSTMLQGVSQGYSPMELYNMGSITTFSPETDVYSLAATLYYLVTGNVPHSAAEIYDKGISMPSDVSSATANAIRSAMVTRSKRPVSVDSWLTVLLANTTAYNSNTNTRSKNDSSTTEYEQTRIIDSNPTAKPKPKPKVEKLRINQNTKIKLNPITSLKFGLSRVAVF
ncbi:MAG: protein kinase, partial [Bacteroidales bacterium]|nr:protein kinase [Bacteroidales bacterium]